MLRNGKNTDIGLMKKADDTAMGDRFKQIEAESRGIEYIDPKKAFVVRVDGRAFHTFTRGMARPYSHELDRMREEAANAVIRSLKPDYAYYQSDEISYVWTAPTNPAAEHIFAGRVDKIVSLCASLTSVAFFAEYMRSAEYDADRGALPHFDGRLAGQFEDPLEAIECVMWRENDAKRNSVQMLAQSMFSHKQLQNKNVFAQYEMCKQAGTDWLVDVPAQYRGGTYLRTVTAQVVLSEEQLANIPEAHRPAAGTTVPRSVFKKFFFSGWDANERFEALCV